jgi:hypothetical protein
LERRLLLHADDPVLVLTETIKHTPEFPTISDVEPFLWHSDPPVEVLWDPYAWNENPPPWHELEDEDGNGYAGDAYGWNFTSNSPNFINDVWHHGRDVTLAAVNVFAPLPEELSEHVKIMYVIGDDVLQGGSDGIDYILNKKLNQGVNIVAVCAVLASVADRAGAEALEEARQRAGRWK